MSFDLDRDSAAEADSGTPLGGSDPVHRRNERIQRALDQAIYAMEAHEDLDGVRQSLESARNLHRQQADAEESGGEMSDAAIAERARQVLDTDFGVGCYVLNGHAQGAYLGAIEDAATIADIITALDTKSDNLADSAVSELAFLQMRILNAAKSVHGCETDRKREGGSHE